MSNLALFLGFPVGIFGLLFLFWRRLKEDYPSEKIFAVSLTVVFFTTLGFILGIFLQSKLHATAIFTPSGLWFWLAFFFTAIGFIFSFYKFKFKFFEALDALALGFIFWFFSIALTNLSPLSFIIALLIPLFFYLNKHYKSFTWYKSGRVGFAGLLTLTIFFLIRLVVALFASHMLFFVGKFDAFISVVCAFGFFITLYKLSNI